MEKFPRRRAESGKGRNPKSKIQSPKKKKIKVERGTRRRQDMTQRSQDAAFEWPMASAGDRNTETGDHACTSLSRARMGIHRPWISDISAVKGLTVLRRFCARPILACLDVWWLAQVRCSADKPALNGIGFPHQPFPPPPPNPGAARYRYQTSVSLSLLPSPPTIALQFGLCFGNSLLIRYLSGVGLGGRRRGGPTVCHATVVPTK